MEISCYTKLLYFTDIYKIAKPMRHKTSSQLFPGIAETIEYIKSQNRKNILNDVFECCFVLGITNKCDTDWSVSIYKCYNPFCDFVLKFQKEDAIVIIKPCGQIEKRKGGECIHDLWELPTDLVMFGFTIMDGITKNNIAIDLDKQSNTIKI